MYRTTFVLRKLIAALAITCALLSSCFAQDIMVTSGNYSYIADGSSYSGIQGTESRPVNVSSGIHYFFFNIWNTASAGDLVISNPIVVSGPHAADFSVQYLASQTVPPQSSRQLTIVFNPSGPGYREANIRINSNDTGSEAAYEFTIRGYGYEGDYPSGPDLDMSIVESKVRYHKKTNTYSAIIKMEVINEGNQDVEGGVIELFRSSNLYFGPLTPPQTTLALKPVKAAAPGKDPKVKRYKAKIELGQNNEGFVFARAVNSNSDVFWFNNVSSSYYSDQPK